MYPIFEDIKNVNHFVLVSLPSKKQIFQRSGQIAVNPNGVYTGDTPVKYGTEIGERMENFIVNAESASSIVNTPVDTSDKPSARKIVDENSDNK